MKLDPAQVVRKARRLHCEECGAAPDQGCRNRSAAYVHKPRYKAGVHALIAGLESTASPVTATGRAAGYLVGVTRPVDQAAFDAAQDGSVPWRTEPTKGQP